MDQKADKTDQPTNGCGCVQSFACGLMGAATALLIGWLDAPTDNDPNDPLKYEGYTPFVLFVLPTLGLLMGAMVGWITAGAWKFAGLRGLALGLAGLLLGLGIGKLILSNQGEGGPLVFHLFLSGGLAYFGFLSATWSAERRPRQASNLDGWDE